MLIYFAAFTVLATELPNYAASVMGGTPISSTGVGGLIGRGTGVGSALKMAKGAAGAGRYLKGKFGNKFS
jgi:type IV secretion system protein VirB6